MISVRDLVVDIAGVRVLDRVSFELLPGRSLALVGSSGAGKSMTLLALLGLLPRGARVVSGSIVLFDRDLSSISAEELRSLRGRRIAAVFQDPGVALNPIMRIGSQIAEAVRAHRAVSRAAAWEEATAMLARVELAPGVARMFPHQLSGGMKQRAVIAMALVHGPDLLVADEATSSLDSTTEAAIVELLVRERRGLLMITHDLALARGACEEIAVMERGRIVELGPAERVFAAPAHPLTRALVELA